MRTRLKGHCYLGVFLLSFCAQIYVDHIGPKRLSEEVIKVKVKVKVALLSITLHVKTYKGIEKTFPTLPR